MRRVLFGFLKEVDMQLGDLVPMVRVNVEARFPMNNVFILEITIVAKCIPDIRKAMFKSNSPAAKVIMKQLIRMVNQSDNLFSHRNVEVATESVIALEKLTSLDKFLCTEHSKTIVEFEGVQFMQKRVALSAKQYTDASSLSQLTDITVGPHFSNAIDAYMRKCKEFYKWALDDSVT
ncbi:glycoside hydrolase, family 28 [Artemisia annua]|uniref:Glycoside hydrolase, family 28 n=1 Tax=Artemisia annua TaxID=35608 RepID=A0A2U1L6Y4_ARTAN|nr:glycoside hydrolase, family 28 [Artemisia annua]